MTVLSNENGESQGRLILKRFVKEKGYSVSPRKVFQSLINDRGGFARVRA